MSHQHLVLSGVGHTVTQEGINSTLELFRRTRVSSRPKRKSADVTLRSFAYTASFFNSS